MAAIDVDMPAIGCIPYLHREVITSRGDALAIGRPRRRIDMISMATIDVEMPAVGCIPHLHCAIITRRGDVLAIRRPRHRTDTGGMATISIESRSVGGRSSSLGCGEGVAMRCGGSGDLGCGRSVGRRATRCDERGDTTPCKSESC